MTTDPIPPGYDLATVERVILEEAIGLHPHNLSTQELCLRIISEPGDRREMETATQAVDGLKEDGLFCDRDDAVVEPTLAALRAGAHLMGPICVSL